MNLFQVEEALTRPKNPNINTTDPLRQGGVDTIAQIDQQILNTSRREHRKGTFSLIQ